MKVKFAVVAVVTGSGFALMNVSGGTATSHMYSAGVSSLSPSGLRAATSNSCSPSIRFAYVFGEEQSVSSAPSSAQKKTELVWSDENVKVAFAGAPVAGGVSPRVVSGGPTIVQLYVAHSPTLSPRSVARTRKVCGP